jgi:hypothetical protein
MRPGRKSNRQRVDGSKRPLAVDLETDRVVAVAIPRAHRPEGEAAEPLAADLARQGLTVAERSIDRADLGAPVVQAYRDAGTPVFCKAFP